MWRLALITMVALALAGCGAARVHFRPTENVTTLLGRAPAASYLLDEDDAAAGRVLLKAEGLGPDDDEGRMHWSILVSFLAVNRSETPTTIAAADLRIIDDEGAEMTPAAFYVDGLTSDELVVADAWGHAVAVFELPEGLSLEDLGSFRVLWKLTVGENDRALETKFLRIRYTSRYHHRHHYRRHYYDPYYHGRFHYYGPGLHIGVGTVFTF